MHTFNIQQTLISLDLRQNHIGPVQIKYLATALIENEVYLTVYNDPVSTHINLIFQTLMKLNIEGNRIGAAGALHLINLFKWNPVRLFSSRCFFRASILLHVDTDGKNRYQSASFLQYMV